MTTVEITGFALAQEFPTVEPTMLPRQDLREGMFDHYANYSKNFAWCGMFPVDEIEASLDERTVTGPEYKHTEHGYEFGGRGFYKREALWPRLGEWWRNRTIREFAEKAINEKVGAGVRKHYHARTLSTGSVFKVAKQLRKQGFPIDLALLILTR